MAAAGVIMAAATVGSLIVGGISAHSQQQKAEEQQQLQRKQFRETLLGKTAAYEEKQMVAESKEEYWGAEAEAREKTGKWEIGQLGREWERKIGGQRAGFGATGVKGASRSLFLQEQSKMAAEDVEQLRSNWAKKVEKARIKEERAGELAGKYETLATETEERRKKLGLYTAKERKKIL